MPTNPARLRRRVARAVFGAAIAGFSLSSAGAQQSANRPTVAIMYFNNGSLVDHEEYQPMTKGMADILITEMQSNPRIRVIERDALQKLLDEQKLTEEKRTDPATSARLGKILGAQHMILGGFFIDRKGRLRLDARAVNVETSEIEHVETANGTADDVLDVIADLARRLNAGLKLPGRPVGTRDAGAGESRTGESRATTTASVSPFKAMMTYARALSEDDSHNSKQALALYQQFLRETGPTYAVAQRQRAEERVRALSGG